MRWFILSVFFTILVGGLYLVVEGRVFKKPWESNNLSRLETHFSVSGKRVMASQNRSGNRVECAKDRYTLSTIQEDINTHLRENKLDEAYESRGNRDRSWRGIPLDGISKGHVRYFFDSSRVLTRRIDVSKCRTASCVFNTIYRRDEDDIIGYAAFLFFLKTRRSLSGIRDTPANYDFSQIPLSSFYFKPDEISYFWHWQMLVPSQLLNIHRVQVYRFPYGYNHRNWAGVAYHKGNEMKVLFTDGAFHGRGSSLGIITHEFAHIYDFKHKITKKNIFKSFSGWHIREYYDRNNRFVRQWVTRENETGFDGFITRYARTDPREDFADSVKAYLHTPSQLERCCPRKFDYIKEHVFEGRSYTARGKRDFFKSELLSYTQDHWESWFVSCERDTSIVDRSKERISFSFDASVRGHFLTAGIQPTELSCFESKISEGIAGRVAELKYNEYQACDFFDSEELGTLQWWDQAVNDESVYRPWVQKLVDTRGEREKVIAIQNFQNQLSEKLDLGELVIQCSKENNPSECFDKAVRDYAESIVEDETVLDEEMVKSELERFLAENTYEKSYQETVERVRNITQISPDEMKVSAEGLISDCSKERDFSVSDEDSVDYQNTNYLFKSWFLDCINAQYKDKAQNIIEQSIDGFGLDLEPVFILFVSRIYKTDFLSAIDEIVNLQAKQQEDEIKGKKNTIMTAVLEDFKNNDYWDLDGGDVEDLLGECRRRGREVIDRIGESEDYIIEFVPVWANELCVDLSSNEDYAFFRERIAFEKLKSIFEEEWVKNTEKCSTKYCKALQIIPTVNRALEIYRAELVAQGLEADTTVLMRDLIAWAKSNLE